MGRFNYDHGIANGLNCITYKWGDRDAVGGPPIQILEMVDSGETNNGVNKCRLLRSAVHGVGIGNLNGSRKSMVRGDRLSTFCSLLTIWSRERF